MAHIYASRCDFVAVVTHAVRQRGLIADGRDIDPNDGALRRR